jgi:hypothetical protein
MDFTDETIPMPRIGDQAPVFDAVTTQGKIHFPLAFHCEKMYYIDMEIVKFRTQVLHFSVTPKELRKRRLRQKSLIYYIILYSVPHQKGWFF